jgi:hypothetical protein
MGQTQKRIFTKNASRLRFFARGYYVRRRFPRAIDVVRGPEKNIFDPFIFLGDLFLPFSSKTEASMIMTCFLAKGSSADFIPDLRLRKNGVVFFSRGTANENPEGPDS